jgi:hypothetical protein
MNQNYAGRLLINGQYKEKYYNILVYINIIKNTGF